MDIEVNPPIQGFTDATILGSQAKQNTGGLGGRQCASMHERLFHALG
jgi:hypothetical protein